MQPAFYFISVVAAGVFLVGWIWYFQPGITLLEGFAGVALALVLRRILYQGLARGGK